MLNLVKHDLEEKIKRISETENVIKEIDFNIDIDKEKSGYYIINDVTGELNFIYGESKSLLTEGGYFLDEPDIFVKTDELVMKPTEKLLSPMTKASNLARSVYSIQYELKDDDIICFDTNEFDDIILITLLDEEHIRKVILEDKKGEFPQIDLVICKDGDLITVNNRMQIVLDVIEQKSNKYIIDFKNGIVYRNNKRYLFNPKLGIKNDINNIHLNYIIRKQESNGITIKSNQLHSCKKNGFIYLEPLGLTNGKSYKINMFCKGNVEIQKYNYEQDKWIGVQNESLTENDTQKLWIRLELESYSEVFKILIIEK